MPKGDDGKRLENVVAATLKKRLDYIEDTKGVDTGLFYLKTKDGKELDFVVAQNDRLTHSFEVKLSDSARSKAFDHFTEYLAGTHKIQLVMRCDREKTFPGGLEVRRAAEYLASIDLEK